MIISEENLALTDKTSNLIIAENLKDALNFVRFKISVFYLSLKLSQLIQKKLLVIGC